MHYLPVRLECWVVFPPLHTDGDHPVESEEAGAGHGVEGYEGTGGEGQVEFIRQGAGPEVPADTPSLLHVRLKHVEKYILWQDMNLVKLPLHNADCQEVGNV